MRWATFSEVGAASGTAQDRVGLVVGEEIYALEPGVELVSLLGDDGGRLAEAGERVLRSPVSVHSLDQIQLRPPIPRPRTIRDFSVFEQHIRAGLNAQGFDVPNSWYEAPVFWFCNVNSVTANDDTVVFPENTREMDYELSVAMIIGKPGIDLEPKEAEAHIAGFCLFNDWSARDLQRDEMHRAPIGPAKGKDFASSLGPFLVTPDELADRRTERAYDVKLTATVNGKQYSEGNWDDVYWTAGEMIAYASRYAVLYPGDVLSTGTCGSGCLLELTQTHGVEEYPWLEDGDEVVLGAERLGMLRNVLRRGDQPKPLR
jgi:2-keto-4-pentenoate hydratase/2-oxohepta-3-ene-1,7-dioic acid hydratase in catechol pathway